MTRTGYYYFKTVRRSRPIVRVRSGGCLEDIEAKPSVPGGAVAARSCSAQNISSYTTGFAGKLGRSAAESSVEKMHERSSFTLHVWFVLPFRAYCALEHANYTFSATLDRSGRPLSPRCIT